MGRRLQQMPAIFSYLFAQGFLSRLFFGKALQLKAMHIAIKPVGADDLQQPVRCHVRELIESRSQALSHTFQATQPAHLRQHKGRIGALFPSSFEPLVLATDLQNGLQQTILG
jgi:hypothetical protein